MTIAKLEREIATLGDLPRAELIERWKSLYRVDPPKGISQGFLIRAIAYDIQTRQYGGLKQVTARRLTMIADGTQDGVQENGNSASVLHPGARLVREWNGISHVVDVVEGGFIWNGDQYGSLTAVAYAITGARWSGPRFFGLTSSNNQ